MKSFDKKHTLLAAACALALGIASAAQAQTNFGPANDRELWTDTPAAQVWKNGYGECWHSAYGPPPPAGECNPAQKVAAPAPYVAPYVPPVVVAAVDPKPVYRRVSFDANVLFDFDKSVLRPEGRATLDDFVAKTRDLVDPEAIVAVGYADRFGTDVYNQKLSERRVATVKGYLESKGVRGGAVGANGVGESQPTTHGECKGGTADAKTIACLQPDRHVYIKLTGSQLVK